MEAYSGFYVEYDNSKSLRHNCLNLSMEYGIKHVVRRIYKLVYRNAKSVDDIKALAVLFVNKRVYFRVYFATFVVEVPNNYILGKNN